MGFGIRVQRIWKINLAGCSGPQKRYNTRFQTYFGPILGVSPFQAFWGFRTRVQGKGSKHGFRVMVQRTGKHYLAGAFRKSEQFSDDLEKIQFGWLLWAFRTSVQFEVTNTISEPILTNPFRSFTWKFRPE